MGRPLFSVIIPTYGRPGLLADAVASVLAQTVREVECIVVDDASPEPVQIEEDGPVWVVRRDVNGGAGAARNSGMNVARGRFFTFLDDDDLYTPDRLELALKGLERAPVCVCWSRYSDEAEKPQRILEGDAHEVIAQTTTPPMGVTAMHQEAALAFDERFRTAEDIDWWIRTTEAHSVSTVPQVGCLIGRHTGARTGYGLECRIADSQLVMDVHQDYFVANPKARAFRWRRVGLMSQKVGDDQAARRAFLKALRAWPSPRDLKHLLTSIRTNRVVDRNASVAD
jgi:glycosyltransferase involved in cell wall biosynthesis